jgi:hypothetical protein
MPIFCQVLIFDSLMLSVGELNSLLCAHSLPVNRAGAHFHSFDLANEVSAHNKWVNGKICTVPGLQKQLQTALILSVTFI